MAVDDMHRDRLASRIAVTDRAKFPGADALAQEASLTLIRAFGTLNTLIDEYLALFGLTRTRLHVLAFLNHEEGDVRMTDIGGWLGVSKAYVTSLVDGLEREGLVERVASSSDRRATFIAVTSAGRARLNEVLPRHLEHLGQLWAGLDDDEKIVLTHLLAKTRSKLLEASGKAERPQPAFPT
ncbi:MAG: MarR family transcriptional regulator, partial [Chloroflexota bacterium]|nr:MarR family transcriptional regulator [Chloroflexota bacterium]